MNESPVENNWESSFGQLFQADEWGVLQARDRSVRDFISQLLIKERKKEYSQTVLVLSRLMVNSKTEPELDAIERCLRAIGEDYKSRKGT